MYTYALRVGVRIYITVLLPSIFHIQFRESMSEDLETSLLEPLSSFALESQREDSSVAFVPEEQGPASPTWATMMLVGIPSAPFSPCSLLFLLELSVLSFPVSCCSTQE